jgi:hypothetical protein
MHQSRRYDYKHPILQQRGNLHDTSVKERAVNNQATHDMFMNVFNSLRGHLRQANTDNTLVFSDKGTAQKEYRSRSSSLKREPSPSAM